MVTTKIWAKKISLRWPESDLENKFLKYQKKLKANVWNLDLAEKGKITCLKNSCCFFSGYIQKDVKEIL